MKKVGEHVTIDFLGVKQDYSPSFYSKIIYKIAKKTKVEVLNIAEHKFKTTWIYLRSSFSRESYEFSYISRKRHN